MKRIALVTGLAAVLVGAVALPASAHVTVAAPGVSAGASDAQITFRVPNESATASTTAVTVALPVDHPLLGVLAAPVPGWSSTLTEARLRKPVKTDDGTITQAVSRIEWKATSGSAGVKPGEVGLFTIVAGQLPAGVSSLTFPAIQTYSNGQQVKWIEVAAPGSDAQPDHPAPTLQLAAASGPAGGSGSSASSGGGTSASSASSSGSSNTGAIVLGIAAVVVAAIALGVALVGNARRRSSA